MATILFEGKRMNFDYSYHKVACKCGREFLVEIPLIGTDHNAGVYVTCKQCLKLPLDAEFVKDNPEAAKDIEAWIKGEKNI